MLFSKEKRPIHCITGASTARDHITKTSHFFTCMSTRFHFYSFLQRLHELLCVRRVSVCKPLSMPYAHAKATLARSIAAWPPLPCHSAFHFNSQPLPDDVPWHRCFLSPLLSTINPMLQIIKAEGIASGCCCCSCECAPPHTHAVKPWHGHDGWQEAEDSHSLSYVAVSAKMRT